MRIDWNVTFSIITAVVAVLALWQTRQQIKTSNRQHLFDKRIENYLIASGLIQLYLGNRTHLDARKEKPLFEVDLLFNWLTNNTFLNQIYDVINNPFAEPIHKNFLIKIEEIKAVASKTEFLFSGENAKLMSEFIIRYQELLFSMYQYQILLNHMKSNAEEFKLELEEAQELFGERKQYAELYQAIYNLRQTYEQLERTNAVEKMKKQIKLK